MDVHIYLLFSFYSQLLLCHYFIIIIIIIIMIDTTVIVVMVVVYNCLYLEHFLLLTYIIINIFVNVKDLVLDIFRDLLF